MVLKRCRPQRLEFKCRIETLVLRRRRPLCQCPSQYEYYRPVQRLQYPAAIGAAHAEGIDEATIDKAIQTFHSVAGRFELVEAGQPFAIVVDYSIRRTASKRLWKRRGP